MNDPIQRILIRFPNWVGDVVMAEPVIRILKSNLPSSFPPSGHIIWSNGKINPHACCGHLNL